MVTGETRRVGAGRNLDFSYRTTRSGTEFDNGTRMLLLVDYFIFLLAKLLKNPPIAHTVIVYYISIMYVMLAYTKYLNK